MAKKLSVEDRLRILEDIEAIKKLKANYCYTIDTGNYDAFVNLFAKDVMWDGGPFGKYVGKKEVERFAKEVVAKQFQLHIVMVSNPVIEVSGEKAKGKWYFLVPGILGGEAIWLQGKYDEEYVKEGGEWKIKLCIVSINFLTPYDKGWVKQRGI